MGICAQYFELLAGVQWFTAFARESPVASVKAGDVQVISPFGLEAGLHKPFNARTFETAPSLVFAPEVGLERAPERFVKLAGITVPVSAHEYEVSNEIRRMELGPVAVQRLENDLRIVFRA